MKQIEKLQKYCKENLLDVGFSDDEAFMRLDNLTYLIMLEDQDVFTEDFEHMIDTYDGVPTYDGCVYEFGGRWYLQLVGEDVSLTELRYIGRSNTKMPNKAFLGIRSGHELVNGTGLYEAWIKKAKFLGIETLGICEKNLSGVLKFQTLCQRAGIKSIIGMTIPIVGNSGVEYDSKVYVRNFQGWLNLLKINTALNIDGVHRLGTDFLVENEDGLTFVADPKSMPYEEATPLFDYYQLDTAQFIDPELDIEYMDNLEKFITQPYIEPISITDAFYLEKDDYKTREILWQIGKKFDDRLTNQHFKSKDEYAKDLILLFEKGNKTFRTLFANATTNEYALSLDCNFEYDTATRHLPRYIMTAEEKKLYGTNRQMFMTLVRDGLRTRGVQTQEYIDRLKVEIKVLQDGDVVDYFLSLYDIVRWSRDQGYLTGLGRGSAGGSLVAYLLGIIQINPLQFDLLFERFLNSGRMGSWEERPMFECTMEDGSKIELAEGTLVRIIRNGEEKVVFCHELEDGDDILKY